MKKILLLNYYWPPSGGSAVQRWLDITNNLEKLDVQTYVITIDEKCATFPFIDETLNGRIAGTTKVFKTGSSELFYLYNLITGKKKDKFDERVVNKTKDSFVGKVSRFVRGNFFIPDPRKGWNPHAYKKAVEIINTYKIDIVFTAGPPQSTHLIGLKLKKHFPDIKWIADIHDFWTDIYILKSFYRTKLAHYFDKKLESKVLHTANMIMTHSRSSKMIFENKLKPGIDKNKIFVYTMGFNETLFQRQENALAQKEFIIFYSGILSKKNKAEFFLRIFKELVDANPVFPIKLKFAGSIYKELIDDIQSLSLENHVEYLGYLSHETLVKKLYESTALLLINPFFEDEKYHVPGKLYEYIAAYKPIISISSKDSENEAIIHECNAGKNFDWNEMEQLKKHLSQLMAQWMQSKNIDLPLNANVHKYGRFYETKKLKEIIAGL
ncbi:MAG TPA: glycosyltransferase [Arachidicoccus sp.]